MLLEKLKYTQYNWSALRGFNEDDYGRRADSVHYQRRIWPDPVEFQIGKHNLKSEPIVESTSILIPSLHIKLVLMKQFVKAVDPSSETFEYLNPKIKAGIFVRPQIKL